MARTFTDQEWSKLTDIAHQLGYEHGRRDADAVEIDDDDHARRLLTAITGEPVDGVDLSAEEIDQLTGPLDAAPLSGEYAGDPTPATLYASLGVKAEDDTDDSELCRAYEDSHSEGLAMAVTERCRERLVGARFEVVADGLPQGVGVMVRFDGSTDVSVFVRKDGSLGVQIDTPGGSPENERGPVGLVVMLNDADLYRNPHISDDE